MKKLFVILFICFLGISESFPKTTSKFSLSIGLASNGDGSHGTVSGNVGGDHSIIDHNPSFLLSYQIKKKYFSHNFYTGILFYGNKTWSGYSSEEVFFKPFSIPLMYSLNIHLGFFFLSLGAGFQNIFYSFKDIDSVNEKNDFLVRFSMILGFGFNFSLFKKEFEIGVKEMPLSKYNANRFMHGSVFYAYVGMSL